ncbi:TPA: hypothetical protein ACTW0Y_004444 [Raoultella planticola]
MSTTYNYLNTLILSFEDNYHLPLLAAVNTAHMTGNPESLIEACNATDRAIEALLMIQDVALSQMENASPPLSDDQAWEVANTLEELTSSLQYITAELAQLSLDIAEEYAFCDE